MSLLSRLAVQAARAYGVLSAVDKNKVSADYLVVAGGGGSGGGGGGAGGLLTSTANLSKLNTYSVAVGAGGAGVQCVGGGTSGVAGSNSSISGTGLSTITSVGGGFGGGGVNGGAGGSGGGAGSSGSSVGGGAGTSGQGNNGGSNGAITSSPFPAGGGGGAGAVGGNATSTTQAGNGGNGTASSISGSSVTYAGGGGGGYFSTGGTATTGGTGGGGAGNSNTGNAVSGTANTGGGGGGTGPAYFGGSGGSGVVIIAYTSATPLFVGGTITTSGGKQIHTFTSSGTLSPITPITASYLVVAGGGAGGSGYDSGGGGAGGLLTSSTTIYSGATYIVTVGAGGATVAGLTGANGSNSVISGTGLTTITSTGGGGGGGDNLGNAVGSNGGSGGGGGYPSTVGPGAAGGTGISGQGNNGGSGYLPGGFAQGGGGGGASAVGGNATTTVAGAGGAGTASSITGTSVTYAGGGGGGADYRGSTPGAGGAGGGGAGTLTNGVAGTANLGGGGGGGGFSGSGVTGGTGGSGVVIISYAGSQAFNGGLVTSSGGNTIHTFTSTGALTPLTNNLTNSLRFRASASAYLNRTPTVSGNQKTWTWSAWVKRGTLNSSASFGLFEAFTSPYNSSFRFANDALNFQQNDVSGRNITWTTSAVFRDPSAWYHIVLICDTTQAAVGNAIKMYVNGNQQTVTATINSGSYVQNLDTYVNAVSISQRLGTYYNGSYFDGYMDDINFIDGQALEPYYFGNNDANGVWKPILYKGTYGTNGFYLTFGNTTSTTTLGYDSSPNGNNWTTNNISLTAGTTYDAMTDVPTNTSATVANYCTLNPVDPLNWLSQNASMTLSNGNLKFTSGSAGNMTEGTMGVSSGKWYYEITFESNNTFVGIRATRAIPTGDLTYRYYNNTGDISVCAFNSASPTNVATVASSASGVVMGVAFDLDSNTIAWYKNNTLLYTLTGVVPDTYAPATGGAAVATASINFGQRPFSYTPPSGFVALNTFNLPTPTILQGNKYIDASLYTGNGAGQTIVNGGQFYPSFIWIKSRSNTTNNNLFTSVLSGANILKSNSTDGVVGVTNAVTTFNLNGFTLGSDSGSIGVNINSNTYVAWQWLAEATTGTTTNTNGSITSFINVNTTAGFSQVYWNPGTAANATLGHGLGVAPKMIITKCRGGSTDWAVWHTSIANTQYLVLNSSAAVATGATWWNSTSPTSSVFSVGSSNTTNAATSMVAYCWAEIAGFSKFGSYTGNGSADGTFVYTGFRPKFVMVKRYDTTGEWLINDSSRDLYNPEILYLQPHLTSAEGTLNPSLDFLSNGFKLRTTNGNYNASAGTYIYMAFAEHPFKNANAR